MINDYLYSYANFLMIERRIIGQNSQFCVANLMVDLLELLALIYHFTGLIVIVKQSMLIVEIT